MGLWRQGDGVLIVDWRLLIATRQNTTTIVWIATDNLAIDQLLGNAVMILSHSFVSRSNRSLEVSGCSKHLGSRELNGW